jgi:hypothetical protein
MRNHDVAGVDKRNTLRIGPTFGLSHGASAHVESGGVSQTNYGQGEGISHVSAH